MFISALYGNWILSNGMLYKQRTQSPQRAVLVFFVTLDVKRRHCLVVMEREFKSGNSDGKGNGSDNGTDNGNHNG